jgi:hypothetical protein
LVSDGGGNSSAQLGGGDEAMTIATGRHLGFDEIIIPLGADGRLVTSSRASDIQQC